MSKILYYLPLFFIIHKQRQKYTISSVHATNLYRSTELHTIHSFSEELELLYVVQIFDKSVAGFTKLNVWIYTVV